MRNRKGSGELGTVVIIIAFVIFIAGFYFGLQYTPEPEIIYIRESNQPVKVVFDKEINPLYEVSSYQTKVGDRDFIVYYWIEDYVNNKGDTTRTLHWTWKEVTGPQ